MWVQIVDLPQSPHDTRRQGWGPGRKPGALSISLDNFGEAADVEAGRAGAASAGVHDSIRFLPQLLDIVEDHPVTYFLEAINTALYPEHIRSIGEAGIEIGLHGWRHENWRACPPPRRQAILANSLQAFQELGVRPRGFRPPGGVLPEGALRELAHTGLSYCSPLGAAGASHLRDGVAVLPFSWAHVDAYQLDPALGAVRKKFGDREAPASWQDWERSLEAAMEMAVRNRAHVTVIFHPYLLARNETMTSALRRLFRSLPSIGQDLWVARCGTIADWLLQPGGQAAHPRRQA